MAILEMLADSGREAMKCYRSFVETALGEELESPLKKVYGGVLLGGEKFIKSVLKEIGNGQLSREDVSYRKTLSKPVMAEEIFSTVCAHYGIPKEEVASHNRARKLCVYLLKRHTVATTREIGALL